MSGSECIHYINVSVRSESLSEFLLTFLHLLLSSIEFGSTLFNVNGLTFFFGIVAEVLEKENFTGLESSSSVCSLCTVRSELYFGYTKSSSNSFLDLTEREFGLNLTLGLTHVAHDDKRTTTFEDVLESGHCTADTGVVSDNAFLQRYIEVNANDSFLASEIAFRNCHNVFVLLLINNCNLSGLH